MANLKPGILCKTADDGKVFLDTDGYTIHAWGTFHEGGEVDRITFAGAAVHHNRNGNIPEVWLIASHGEPVVEVGIHADYALDVEQFLVQYAPHITSISGLLTPSWLRARDARDEKLVAAIAERNFFERNEKANEQFVEPVFYQRDLIADLMADGEKTSEKLVIVPETKPCDSCGCAIPIGVATCDTCSMGDEMEDDLKTIVYCSVERIESKYRKGAKEHGGRGWEMGTQKLIANALDEAADLTCYLTWLDQQQQTIYEMARNAMHLIATTEILVGNVDKAHTELKALCAIIEGKPNRG